MQISINSNVNSNDYYGLKLLGFLIFLMLLLALTSFYLFQNYYSNTFLEYALNGKKIYFLKSDTLKDMYDRNGMDYDGYQKRIKYFKHLCLEEKYEALDIESSELSTIDKNAKLIALDMMALSKDEINDIDNFVSKGGKIIFNFTSGFLNSSLQYKSDNLVKRVTTLTLDKDINTIKQDPKNTGYVSTKLSSPFAKYLPKGKALDFAIYDPLPIFDVAKNIDTDTYLTNWSQNNYIHFDKTKILNKSQSGLIWHGYKKLGKWVYFSFPSYVFVDGQKNSYSKLFRGMLEYLDNDIIPIIYPYIDAKNVVFISEDTEYKYENLASFSNVSLKNKFPVTAFCVANLAEKFPIIQKNVAKSKYMEIGSHSYTHKKIVGESDEVYKRETGGSKKLLKHLSHQNIVGFRPPREEIDEKMIALLEESGFKYILSAGENRLAPYFDGKILIIPRHGTDDYSYLINLDWTSSQILEQMKKEVNILCDLNGMYTMSTHTHLMSFSTNINITDKFMQYVNTQKRMSPMNGKMIYDRISKRANLHLSTAQTNKKLIMTFTNDNSVEVKNTHYDLYVDPNIRLGDIESEIIGVKTELIKITPSRYTLIVKSMKPKSKMVLFLNYDKNI